MSLARQWREVVKPLKALNAMTEFRFLSERELLNLLSDTVVTFKTLCLKSHCCSSEKVEEEYD